MPEPGEFRAANPLSRLAASALRAPVRLYRLTLSPLVGHHCRYQPTCSMYADEAIARHGAWAGGWIAAARLGRCHPWGGSGFDPVPDELPAAARWYKPWRYGRWRSRPPG